ncbi:hypothetical protein AYK24_00435 [Thermoplasmatales archaeon SG8-52-4]|nr:MAG: hypothetical protein AYK24_00435 [Thermoplasmatales archaeon SG8-52-4]
MNDYFKLGNEIINLNVVEEKFFADKDKKYSGFGISSGNGILQMFADTFPLIASCNKGLLKINGHFSSDEPPIEYVFDLGFGFYGIFYTIFDGADYIWKASILKQNMTQENAFNIIKELSKIYIKYKKSLQETKFLKGKQILEDVILPYNLKNAILSDFEKFLKSREKYEKFGMIWKRGYIFHGPPGNGKTLFLRKLGLAFGIEMVDIITRIEKDGTIKMPHEYYDQPFADDRSFDIEKFAIGHETDNPVSIYYLEDMDKVIGRNDDDYAKITLSDFLTAIDGVSRLANGLIIIGTTNNTDQLSSAILGRPGRFDRIYEFKKPDISGILGFFKRRQFEIKNEKTTEEYVPKLVKKGFSMAFVEDFVMSSITHYERQTISIKEADYIVVELEKYNKFNVQTESMGFNT